mmetsp:Transcript_5800/g.16276  ORF Transcript_5800/g.16276 Transcript_5800/m.16276 type:complete len:91 (+) Transcript_5800:2382-2654(+)
MVKGSSVLDGGNGKVRVFGKWGRHDDVVHFVCLESLEGERAKRQNQQPYVASNSTCVAAEWGGAAWYHRIPCGCAWHAHGAPFDEVSGAS